MDVRRPLLALTALALVATAAAPAASAEIPEVAPASSEAVDPKVAPSGLNDNSITLRVSVEGLVVPSQHPLTNLPPVDTTTPAVWLVDPAEDDSYNDREGVAGCTLDGQDSNGDGAVDGGEVLDEAADEGCISGWDHEVYQNSGGRYVTCVDGLCQQGAGFATFWGIQIDGHVADVGIDSLDLSDGDSLEFVYRTWA